MAEKKQFVYAVEGVFNFKKGFGKNMIFISMISNKL